MASNRGTGAAAHFNTGVSGAIEGVSLTVGVVGSASLTVLDRKSVV